MEFEVLYHGTKFKYNAFKILKEGFKEWSYFSSNLNNAVGFGGKYVFEVVFLKSDLPDYWQVRCENRIPPERIVRMSKYKSQEIIKNKTLEKKVFSNALEFSYRIPYCFKESGAVLIK